MIRNVKQFILKKTKNQGKQSIPLCNRWYLTVSCDKNHTGLSPHGISVISGFVFMSDQVCSQGYLVTGSIIWTYFPMDLVFIPAYLGYIQGCGGFPSSTPIVHVPILWNTSTA